MPAFLRQIGTGLANVSPSSGGSISGSTKCGLLSKPI